MKTLIAIVPLLGLPLGAFAAASDDGDATEVRQVHHGGGDVKLERGTDLTLVVESDDAVSGNGWECSGGLCEFVYGEVQGDDTVPVPSQNCASCHQGHGCKYNPAECGPVTAGGSIRLCTKGPGASCWWEPL